MYDLQSFVDGSDDGYATVRPVQDLTGLATDERGIQDRHDMKSLRPSNEAMGGLRAVAGKGVGCKDQGGWAHEGKHTRVSGPGPTAPLLSWVPLRPK